MGKQVKQFERGTRIKINGEATSTLDKLNHAQEYFGKNGLIVSGPDALDLYVVRIEGKLVSMPMEFVNDAGLLRRRDYEEALMVMDACNLSGVLLSMSAVLERVKKERNETPDHHRQHPIIQMYAAKVIELTGMGLADIEAFSKANTLVEEFAKETHLCWTV